ncbi:S1C family serine protease [Streptomyces sp. NPDC001594]|uniref:S1C family serine protease n=1 Tax=Streptomyces sp. NPDC001594 TaxID=3364590 RepID=UPI00368B8F61
MKGRAGTTVAIATMAVLATSSHGMVFADDLSPKQIYERAAPATVKITGPKGSGSGIIYDAAKGLIVTNAHVVQGEPSLRVKVEDRAPVSARVLGIDPCEDLAVLAFSSPQPDLKELKFGKSKDVAFADNVTALGYPATFEEQGTSQKPVFTTGAVQNPDVKDAAPDPSLPRYPSTLQHSATVNPGNSGGPLLNGKAEVVGINTLGNGSAGVEGQFYAISSDHARPLIDTLAAGEKRNDPGWELSYLHDPALPDSFVAEDAPAVEKIQKRFPDVEGMIVTEVTTNSAAQKAKLQQLDVITEMKDNPVASYADVCDVLQSASPGETLPLTGIYTEDFTDETGKKIKAGDTWNTDLVVGKGRQ